VRRVCAVVMLLVLIASVAGFRRVAGAESPLSATLPNPLRFSQPVVLGGVQAGRVEVDGNVAGSPVIVSGGEVVGSPGSVPGGTNVSILWRGVEVGRAVAGADGSFRVAAGSLPDARVSVVYGTGLPELKPWLNVGAYIYPNPYGSVSASSWYQPYNERPECLFDHCGTIPSSGYSGSVWGRGFWGSGSSASGWVARDFGREVLVRKVVIWPAGSNTENAWYQVELSGPSGTWSAKSGWIRNVGYTGRVEAGTVGWQVDVPGGFRASRLKLTADLSYNWTGVVELAALADLPVEEALGAPSWTLPGGDGFGIAPVVLVKPASWSGHNPSYWPDPDASWVWCMAGATADAPTGTVRFRVPFEVQQATDAILYVAADDKVTVWLDGVKILYWQAADRYGATPLRLSPGKHVLAFECVNGGRALSDPAGLLVSLKAWSGEVILRSGGPGWETSGYVCPEWAAPEAAQPEVTPVDFGQYGTWYTLSGWPDPGAHYIWVDSGTKSNAPGGEVGFRAEFYLENQTDATLYVAVDDRASVWLDGVLVLNCRYGQVGSVKLSLGPGRHVLAVHAANQYVSASTGNPGSLLVSLRDGSGNVILRSGDPCWKATGYLVKY